MDASADENNLTDSESEFSDNDYDNLRRGSSQMDDGGSQEDSYHSVGDQGSHERPVSIGSASSLDSETIDASSTGWLVPECAELEARERDMLKSRYEPNSAFRLEFPRSIYKFGRDGQLKTRHLVKGHLLQYEPSGLPEQIMGSELDFFQLTQCLPSDNRVQLAVDIPWLWQFENHRLAHENPALDQSALNEMIRERILERIDNLADFDRKLRDNGDGDFWIMDDTAYPIGTQIRQQHLYRGNCGWVTTSSRHMGGSGGQQMPDPFIELQAPWNRLIFCKGLSTVGSPSNRLFQDGSFVFLPYIILDDRKDFSPGSARGQTGDAILEAVRLHLSCSKRFAGELNNPYTDPARGFHITFYERIIGDETYISKEKWKIGHMYTQLDVPPGNRAPMFRRSAFTTVISTDDRLALIKRHRVRRDICRYGTLLVLCPSRSFTNPMAHMQKGEHFVPWIQILNDCSIQISELAMIREAYSMLTQRWLWLKDHLATLLEEDFMEPEKYVKLIFDDDQLSRSKKYFWILACLHEFKGSIADNITQWKLYRQARLDDAENIPPHLQVETMISDLDRFCGMLQETISQMDELVDIVQARRDGLFNASALGESMNSTRLGHNVKLLTYVSIFYLPLAFCAALWAIPNIDQDGTRIAFSVTALVLGLVTYLIVANLENMVHVFKSVYNAWRSHLVQQMKDDPTLYWQTNGQRLEDSWPERKLGPSEWMILQFQAVKLFRGARWKNKWGGVESSASSKNE